MKKSTKESIKAGIVLVVVIFIFGVISYITQNELVDLSIFSDNLLISALIYLILLVAEAIFAPINTMPLIPLAARLFGWWQAAIITLIGWTLGSFLVLIICQKYGKPLIKKMVSLQRLERYEKIIPTEHIFVNVIILRMFMPLDIISYAIGLFTNIKRWHYLLATLIGYAPLVFFVAYLGSVEIKYQILGGIICTTIILIEGVFLIRKKRLMDEVKIIVKRTKKKLDEKKLFRKEKRLLRRRLRRESKN